MVVLGLDPTPTAVREVERLLARCHRQGWGRRSRVFARPVPDLSAGPLAAWRPGEVLPDAAPIAWQAAARWTEPPRPVAVWHAAKRLLSQLGKSGDGRVRQPLQATHDLAVSQVLAELARTPHRAGDAAAWVGEEHLGKLARGKVPDAVITRPDELPLAVDFVGSYPADRISRVMRFYARLGLPFELW